MSSDKERLSSSSSSSSSASETEEDAPLTASGQKAEAPASLASSATKAKAKARKDDDIDVDDDDDDSLSLQEDEEGSAKGPSAPRGMRRSAAKKERKGAVTEYNDYEEDLDNDGCSNIFKSMLAIRGYLNTVLCCPCGVLGCGPVIRVREGQRAAVIRYGKLHRIVGPGTYHYNTGTEQFRIEDIQTRTLDVPKQNMLTRDNVPVEINAVIYYRIEDIRKALFNVSDFCQATTNFAQSTLRTVVGEVTLDELFSDRHGVNTHLTELIDAATDGWGIFVSAVEIKDLVIPVDMQRTMAAVAEATREGSAKIITAKAEKEAAATLSEAAEVMAKNPIALQLRYYQTLTEISAEHNSTIVVPSEFTPNRRDKYASFLEGNGGGASSSSQQRKKKKGGAPDMSFLLPSSTMKSKGKDE
ncbi:Mechanosensory protein 2 [Balamuthia mandrillaris]